MKNTPAVAVAPRSLSPLVLACLAATWLVWGSTYLAIRFALVGFAPFYLMATRFIVAGVLLMGWQLARGAAWPTDTGSGHSWLPGRSVGDRFGDQRVGTGERIESADADARVGRDRICERVAVRRCGFAGHVGTAGGILALDGSARCLGSVAVSRGVWYANRVQCVHGAAGTHFREPGSQLFARQSGRRAPAWSDLGP